MATSSTSDKGTASLQSATGAAVVASGHTIVTVTGEKDDREYLTFGPGETVSLSAREISRLRTLGFLKDDETETEETAAKDGPTVKQEGGGPTVTKGTK